MQRFAAAQAGGTDGSDHGFRMVIENRYKKLAVLRKTLRGAVTAQTLLAFAFAAEQFSSGGVLFGAAIASIALSAGAATFLSLGSRERLAGLRAARYLSAFLLLLCIWDVYSAAASGKSVFGPGNAALRLPGLQAATAIKVTQGISTVLRIALGAAALVSSTRLAAFLKEKGATGAQKKV